MKTLAILIALLSSGNVLSQTTWYISTSGSDLNSGRTSGEAFATVNKAISSASCGDSIYIFSGTYHEKINAWTICPDNNRIVIQGDISKRPLIIGDSTVTNKYAIGATGSGFVFRHLELTSPYPEVCEQSNQVIVGKGDYFDFIDIIVRNSGYDGIKTTSDCETSDFPTYWRIIDSQIYSNGLGCPKAIVNGDGIDFTGCRNCLIQNSIIRDNRGHQIQVKLEAKNVTIEDCHIEGENMLQIGLPGSTPQCDPSAFNADSIVIRYNTMLAKGDTSLFVIKLADVTNLYIENNTIIKDSVNVDVGFICFGGCTSNPNAQQWPISPVVVRNNIFYSRATVPFFAGPDTTFFDPFNVLGSEVTSSYNLFFDTQGEYIIPPDNSPTSIVADPLFCDYPNSYRLSQESPCINNGDPNSPNDPDATRNDIGARYYQTACVLSSVKDKETSSAFVYPNPTSQRIVIAVKEEHIGTEFQLYNSLGKAVIVSTIQSNRQTVNLENLHSGIYLYQLKGVDQQIVRSGELIIR